MSDARIETSFRTHPKRVKLHRRLGADGPLAFLDLLLFATESRPNGILDSAEDVEIAAQWAGDEGKLVETLIELTLLDKEKGGKLRIHDWNEHNAFAANAPSRRFAARLANHVRWLKARGIACPEKACEFCAPDAKRSPVRSTRARKAESPSSSSSSSSSTSSTGLPSGEEAVFNPEKEFEDIWQECVDSGKPVAQGKKQAKVAFLSSVKTPEDAARCRAARRAYANTASSPYVKHGSTWFRNWEDDAVLAERRGVSDDGTVGGYSLQQYPEEAEVSV